MPLYKGIEPCYMLLKRVPSGTFFVYRHEIYQTSNDAGTAVLVGSPDAYGMNKNLSSEEVLFGWQELE